MGYSIEYFCVSDRGKLRTKNQDNFFCFDTYAALENGEKQSLLHGKADLCAFPRFAVFDGMGGEEHGEIAAYIAVRQFSAYAFSNSPETEFPDFCRTANQDICDYAKTHALRSMGTTAAIVIFNEDTAHICNIGDSKIFKLSKKTLTQLSCDHLAFAPFGRKPPLSQNLGIPEDELILEPHIAADPCKASDVYLICSDGLTDMLSTDEISDILIHSEKDAAIDRLLTMALDKGGRDNITILLLYVCKKPNPIKSLLNHLRIGSDKTE